MSNRHPPPTKAKKSGPDVSPSEAADSQNKKFNHMRICLAHCQYTRVVYSGQHSPQTQPTLFDDLAGLIAQAQRQALTAAPGDSRHAAILGSLRRLAREYAGEYRPGPRFGLGVYKSHDTSRGDYET